MLDKPKICGLLLAASLAGCAVQEPKVVEQPPAAPAAAPATGLAQPSAREREQALAEEARALLAQAETDVQRARSRRALWLKAWEDLIAARNAAAARDHATTSRHARRASELALLGLQQLAYPAVK